MWYGMLSGVGCWERIKNLGERDLNVERDFWPVFERCGKSNRGEEVIAVLRG